MLVKVVFAACDAPATVPRVAIGVRLDVSEMTIELPTTPVPNTVVMTPNSRMYLMTQRLVDATSRILTALTATFPAVVPVLTLAANAASGMKFGRFLCW